MGHPFSRRLFRIPPIPGSLFQVSGVAVVAGHRSPVGRLGAYVTDGLEPIMVEESWAHSMTYLTEVTRVAMFLDPNADGGAIGVADPIPS